MGVYLDADDIKQHFQQGRNIKNETIEELMDEQEYYVQTRLGLNILPPSNPLLASIIRDLTIAAGILNLLQPNADTVVKADTLRAEALRRLNEADKSGIGVVTTAPPNHWSQEVYNPYGNTKFFKMDDYFTQDTSQQGY